MNKRPAHGPTTAAGAQPQTGRAPAPQTVDSQALLNGQSVLLIQHQGELYRLQTTRQGKLILTK